MARTIVIDPVTRIEGHLKVEVSVDEGRITESKLTGAMARGIEGLLVGKDPRDATYVTERICGVCFTAHGWTSSLAVEAAHGTTEVPQAARLIRNLIAGAAWLHDHLLHFYQLSVPDYLDFGALSAYQGTDETIRRINALVEANKGNPFTSGSYAAPFLPGYQPDEYSVTDTDSVATLLQHYFASIEMQIKSRQMSALLGGKQPHQSSIVAGGVTYLPPPEVLATFASMLDEQINFIDNVYIEDVIQLANGPLSELARQGVGLGVANYMSFGGFPEDEGFVFPEGVVTGETLVTASRSNIEAQITEDVARGWYASDTGGHPAQSVESFDLDKTGAYSFIKAPRLDGRPMEVGPLARMMVTIARTDHAAWAHPGVDMFRRLIQDGYRPGIVMRHVARAIETRLLYEAMQRWVAELSPLLSSSRNPRNATEIHDSAHWEPPQTGEGVGMTEAPRGSLGHWIEIENAKIRHYACVTPTTWNGSPADEQSVAGPMEAALVGSAVPDADNPIGIARCVRSFDPCVACAVHMISRNGKIEKWLSIR